MRLLQNTLCMHQSPGVTQTTHRGVLTFLVVGVVVVVVAVVAAAAVESGKVSGKIIQVSTADPSSSATEEGGAGGGVSQVKNVTV